MTALGQLLRSNNLEDPTVPISSHSLADWLTGGRTTDAGMVVNEEKAFGLVAYQRGVALLAGTMASLPIKAYADGTRERVRVDVLDNPHPDATRMEVWETSFAHAVGWGNGYIFKQRDRGGTVRSLWPIHPGRVSVDYVDADQLNPAGKVFSVLDRHGRRRTYTSWEILHLPGLSLDGRVGISPVQLARQSLGTGLAAEKFAALFFGQGQLFSGILKSDKDLTPEQAARLKARWKQLVSRGIDSAHEIAVMDNGAEFQPVSIPPSDAQLLESRKWTVTEIARLLGIPPFMLADVEKTTSWGTGVEQQFIGFVQITLRSWLSRFEQRITRELMPSGVYAEFVVDGLLRGDTKTRAEYYAKGVQNGWLNRNDVRAKENLEPVDGLDTFLYPKNLEPVTDPAAGDDDLDVLALTQAIQRIYLGVVNGVLSVDEARDILNRGGADLPALAEEA